MGDRERERERHRQLEKEKVHSLLPLFFPGLKLAIICRSEGGREGKVGISVERRGESSGGE